MIIPLFALIIVIAVVIWYFVFNSKHKDVGNRRGA